jgi:hypothetical protein
MEEAWIEKEGGGSFAPTTRKQPDEGRWGIGT